MRKLYNWDWWADNANFIKHFYKASVQLIKIFKTSKFRSYYPTFSHISINWVKVIILLCHFLTFISISFRSFLTKIYFTAKQFQTFGCKYFIIQNCYFELTVAQFYCQTILGDKKSSYKHENLIYLSVGW